MLLSLVIIYLLITIAIGLYASKLVSNASDYAIAGKNLPLAMIITTTFATWFGSETVLGIPAKFIKGGLHSLAEDPFGSGCCLILVGMFFASKLYKMNLLTISDFFRERYGKFVEIACSVIIMLSYLGWVSAQVTALGLMFHLLSDGWIATEVGMILGTFSILAYTLFGGMWSVAVTDFIQMIILVTGLSMLAIFATDLAGGIDVVMDIAKSKDLLRLFPESTFKETLFFIASGITMMFGSIPQQDVFQRVMSARNEKAAVLGPIIGGICYMLFAFVPMFIVTSSFAIMPAEAQSLLESDPQRLLPTLVMQKMPFFMQVMFFGALLSAVKSAASATLLAPSITFVENIWYQIKEPANDKQQLKRMRITVLCFSLFVLSYAMTMYGKPIYELVSTAYQVTLVGAFVPLVCGLYWQKATTQGAIASILLGITTWVIFLLSPLETVFPAQLAGFLAAWTGMIVGSLSNQKISNYHGTHHNLELHSLKN